MSEGGSKWGYYLGIAACAGAVAGAAYLAYRVISYEEPEPPPAEPPAAKAAAAAEARAAKSTASGSSAQGSAGSTKPLLPPRKAPANKAAVAAPSAGSSTAPVAAATSAAPAPAPAAATARKQCANCSKALSGLPLRCSQCKSVYYCSSDCQKAAWPAHKEECKNPKAASTSTSTKAEPESASTKEDSESSSSQQPQEQSQSSAAAAAAAADVTASANADADQQASADAGADSTVPKADEATSTPTEATSADSAAAVSEQPAAAATADAGVLDMVDGSASQSETGEADFDIQEALAQHLRQTLGNRATSIEGQFQMAVMYFIQGATRQSLPLFQQVIEQIKKEDGNKELQAEGYKWLGHAHNRLSDFSKAVQTFEEGVAFAASHGFPKQQAACLAGMGLSYRSQGQVTKAVECLEEALKVTDSLGDQIERASVLTNLGSTLMAVDTARGLKLLQEAVDIRHETVEMHFQTNDRNGLVTSVLEHASALVNLASALYSCQKLTEAKTAYEQALTVFEEIEDADKVSKVLLNLHNMSEIHMKDREAARSYRTKLMNFLRDHSQQEVPSTCSICHEDLHMSELTESEDKELLMLACLHPFHNTCFQNWCQTADNKGQNSTCPTCRTPVPMFPGADV